MDQSIAESRPITFDGDYEVPVPSRSYVANAIPADDGGYMAQFSAPGLIPRYSTFPNNPDKPRIFDTIAEAEDEARKALFAILNAPRKRLAGAIGKPERYEKMSGPEFAVALHGTGMAPHLFAFIYGTSQARVLQWIDGVENVPHAARVLLAILQAFPNAIDLAERVTEAVTTERKPKRD